MPLEITSSIRYCFTVSESAVSLMLLVMVTLDFPTLLLNSSGVKLKSLKSFLYAKAYSIGFKSCLWIFSIKEISNIFLSVKSITIAGTSFNPTNFAALHLLSPAIIT